MKSNNFRLEVQITFYYSDMFSYTVNLFGRQSLSSTGSETDNKKSVTQAFIKFPEVIDFLFISCPELGQKEGWEHERIMYFYPSDYYTIDKQVHTIYHIICKFLIGLKYLRKIGNK